MGEEGMGIREKIGCDWVGWDWYWYGIGLVLDGLDWQLGLVWYGIGIGMVLDWYWIGLELD
jgi:hypothetical protein